MKNSIMCSFENGSFYGAGENLEVRPEKWGLSKCGVKSYNVKTQL